MQKILEISTSIVIAALPALAVYNFLPGMSLAFFLLWVCSIPLLLIRKNNTYNYDEIFVLYCIVLISLLSCSFHLAMCVEWFDYVLFTHNIYAVLVCFIPLCFVSNNINVDIFIRTVLFVGVIASIVLIWQWISLFLTGSFQMDVFVPGLEVNRDLKSFTKFRPSSFFTEPAHFAIYLLPAFQIALLYEKKVLICLFVFSLLCSGSGTGLILLLILIVYHLCLVGLKKWYVALVGASLLVACVYIVYVFLPEIFLVFSQKYDSVSDGESDVRLLGPLMYLRLFQFYEHFFGITLNQLSNLLVMEGSFGFGKNYANAAIYTYISYGLIGFVAFLSYIRRKWKSIKDYYGFFLIFIGVFCSDQIMFNAHFFYLITFVLLTNKIYESPNCIFNKKHKYGVLP